MEDKEHLVLTRRPIRPQLVFCGVLCAAACNNGISNGHSAVLLPRLQHNSSSIPTDEDMGSWIGGALADCWGRRTTLRLSMPLALLGWLLIAFANNHGMLIAARLILGFAKGMGADALMVLVDELSDSRMRGTIMGIAAVSLVLGMLAVLGLGSLLQWRVLAGVAAIVPVFVLIAAILLPESPMWQIRHGYHQKASKSLDKLWGRHNIAQARREYNYMMSRCRKESRLHVKTFLEPRVLKPFIISQILILLQPLCGTTLFIFYSVDVISRSRQESSPVMDDFVASTICAAVRLVVIILSSYILFFVGRRPIVITCGISTAVCCAALGTVLYLGLSSWTPLILTFMYVLTSTSGLFLLPIIMAGELVPSQVRGIICGWIFAVNDIFFVGLAKAYPWMTNTIGMHGIFWMFGIFSLLSAVFVFLFVPETKGRSLPEIEDYFRGSNVLWHNRERPSKDIQYEEVKLNIR